MAALVHLVIAFDARLGIQVLLVQHQVAVASDHHRTVHARNRLFHFALIFRRRFRGTGAAHDR